MANISTIKKKILSRNDVFDSWEKDLGHFENTYAYAECLANEMLNIGGLYALQELADGKLPLNHNMISCLNTYPFGEKGNVYPEFLGVCVGDQKLYNLYKFINKQLTYYMSGMFGIDEIKSITIFIDRWNPKLFSKNEAVFLQAALKYNVFFNFYLVTDYGISRIPFLNDMQRNHLLDIFKDDVIEESQTLEELLCNMDIDSMVYTVETFNVWTVDRYNLRSERYIFDFMKLHYEYKNEESVNKNGEINKDYALKFIMSVIELKKAGGIEKTPVEDCYICKSVDFGSFSFEWYDVKYMAFSPEADAMIKALNDMINSLK